jgi:hypothetical protein
MKGMIYNSQGVGYHITWLDSVGELCPLTPPGLIPIYDGWNGKLDDENDDGSCGA